MPESYAELCTQATHELRAMKDDLEGWLAPYLERLTIVGGGKVVNEGYELLDQVLKYGPAAWYVDCQVDGIAFDVGFGEVGEGGNWGISDLVVCGDWDCGDFIAGKLSAELQDLLGEPAGPVLDSLSGESLTDWIQGWAEAFQSAKDNETTNRLTTALVGQTITEVEQICSGHYRLKTSGGAVIETDRLGAGS